MNIRFKTLHMHHFLSFEDDTINLLEMGCCSVEGVNKCVEDASKSNGSGKSTIWNAISYALLGETIQGVRSNLANLYFNDGCYVELEFDVDNVPYRILRSKDDEKLGTNLKLYINDVDKSGKGIRESQALLEQYLPELTSELLNNVIILGQGLPNRFTNNTPSGRKEVLEHLSKSEFMIEDLKKRLSERQELLNNNLRENQIEESSLCGIEYALNNQLKLKSEQLQELLNTDTKTLTDKMSILENSIIKNNTDCEKTRKELEQVETDINDKTQEINALTETYYNTLHKLETAFNNEISTLKNQENSFKLEEKHLEEHINKIENIKDVCPTCGQRIPNVVRPNLTEEYNQLSSLKQQLSSVQSKINTLSQENEEEKKNLKEQFDSDKKQCESELKDLKLIENNLEKFINTCVTENNYRDKQVATIKATLDNYEVNVKNTTKEVNSLKDNIHDTKSRLDDTRKVIEDINNHLDVLSKMSNLIKRDFRGFLLSEIITFIDTTAKYYCSKIFNTRDTSFTLNGNNIDITFRGKDYSSLSGGEKQRMDLIIQFAIRDMLCKYSNMSCNILVLDEITDNLDSVSCDRVLSFINEELKDIESIFIISHHGDELNIGNDTKIIVEKDERGVSHIV